MGKKNQEFKFYRAFFFCHADTHCVEMRVRSFVRWQLAGLCFHSDM